MSKFFMVKPLQKRFLPRAIKRILLVASTAMAISSLLLSTQLSATQYSPNFKGTEISEFIDIVGKNLQKTMIVDPNVRGKINIRSYNTFNEEQYYLFFLSVLEVYNFAAVEMDNGVIKIIRNKDAKTSSIPLVGSENTGKGDQMVTRVVEVKNVTVRELVPLLRQLSDQAGGGNVTNYDPANVIMLTGPAAVVNRLVKIIERVDKAGDKNIEIIRLKYASASEIVRIVEAMNKSSQGKAGTPTFLIPKIVADDRTNSVIVSGEIQARERIVKLISRLDSELETNGNTRVYYLKYSKAEDLVKVLEGVSESIEAETKGTKTNSRSSGKKRKVSIDAHVDTNTLVITAQPDMLRSLESVIRQLDVRRAQVLVEAIIVEVFESDGVSLGVQWYSEQGGFTQFTNGPASLTGVAAGAEAARTVQGELVPEVRAADTGELITAAYRKNDTEGDYNLLAQVLGTMSGGMFGIMKNDWGAIVQAVSTDTNSNILATPSITTLDNEEAHFLVGQEVPIITGSAASSGNNNPFQTVDRQEVGIKLIVTPQVNEGSAVQLTIAQEVSSVSGATGVDISINKREIKTTVMVDSGATIILGGLIDEDVQESVQKVPLLGDLPIIGHLFKSTSNTVRKRNLMVFIRPTIVREGIEMEEISKNKYNLIRAEEIVQQEKGLSLMSNENLPLLQKWNDALSLPPSFDDYINKKDAKSDTQDSATESQLQQPPKAQEH